jgi:hypothetical protein
VFANVVNNEGVIRAARIDNSGGMVRLVGSGAPVIQAGVIDVSGADAASTGGRIEILGEKVGIAAGAELRADGAAGGGTILVGGDVQGSGTTPRAEYAFVGDGATLSADALVQGDGGTVVVWADEVARVYGDISARGGATGGDGGFVETSGKGYLDFGGTVSASAANGAAGTWLLDPSNVVISAGATTGITESGTITFSPTTPGAATDTVLNVDDITDALDAGTNVTVNTQSDAAAAGNITVDAEISKTVNNGATTLTLLADNDIVVNQTIESTNGTLDVVLRADRNVTINAAIDANGGAIEASVDLDEATTNNAATLTIGTSATLTAAGIQLNAVNTVQDDTLVVLRGAGNATWTIDGVLGTNTGTVAATAFSTTADFSGFANLTGGDQADTFTFSGVNGSISGTASGAGGNDDFVVNNGVGAAAYNGGAGASDDLDFTGSTGPVSISSGAVTGVELVTDSGDAEDVLEGTGGNDIFTTTGDNEVTFGTVVFAGFENLEGLGGNDTFNLNHDISGTTGVDGGADSDTVVAGAAAVFAITAANAGSLTSGGDNIPFSNVENLTGSGQADTFTFSGVNGSISGTASGAGGNDNFAVDNGLGAAAYDGGAGTSDDLDFTLSTGPVRISSGAVTGIELVTDSGDAQDVLEGTGGNDIFTTTADNEVTFGTVVFAGFENLEGLGGNDTFNLGHNLTGGVDGGDGGDIFNLNATVTGTLDGGAGDDTFNLAETFSATVDGGANDDLIVADATQAPQGSAFAITAPGTGTANDNNGGGVTFSNIEDLTGSNQGDTFDFSLTGSLSGTILGLGGNDVVSTDSFIPDFVGGAGTDRMNLGPSGGGTPFVINAADYAGSFETFDGSPNAEDVLQGTSGPDTFATSGLNQIDFGGTTFRFFENVRGLGDNDVFGIGHNLEGAEGVNGGTGNDTFNFLASGVTTRIDGGDDADSIVAFATTAATFTVGSVNGGTFQNGGLAMSFSNVENLTGGNLGDLFTFNVGGSIGGTATGGSGDDDFNVNSGTGAAVSFDGGTGTSDDLNFSGSAGGPITVAASGFTGIETVTGTALSDTLQGTSGPDAFATTAANNGTLNTTTAFVGFENLQGGDGIDTFTLNHNLTSADGGANNDIFNVGDGGLAVAVTGGSGTDSLRYTGATGPVTVAAGMLAANSIEDVQGSAQGDVLQGTGGPDIFTTTGPNAGNVNGTLTFSSFENLEGLAGIDTFNLNHNITGTAGVDGGADNDTFNLAAGVSATIAGGADTDSIVALGATARAFAINAANIGTATNGAGAITFAGVENVTGGSGGDTFTFTGAGALGGTAAGGDGDDDFLLDNGNIAAATIDGGNGANDEVSFTNFAGPVTLNVSTGFTSIENVTGSGNAQDVLQGTSGANTFTTTAANQVAVSGVTFSSFENLQGAAGNDVFNINHNITGATGVDGGANDDIVNLGAGVVAVVSGGTENDSLRYATQTGPVTIAVDDVIAALFENVVGSSSGADILQGTLGADAFATSAANAGSVAGVTFSSFENLQGLSGDDVFNLNHALSSVDGGSDDDFFNIADGGLTVAVTGGLGTDSQRYAGATGPVTISVGNLAVNSIEDVVGSASGEDILQGLAVADTFTTSGDDAGSVNGALTFSSFENLQGAAGNDVFNLDHNITGTAGVDGGADNDIFNFATGVTATVAGGAGTDSQRYAGATGPVTIGLGTLAATSIEDVVGSLSGEDLLTGTAAAETFTTSGANAGSVAGVTFSSFENLQGAGGNDTFNLGHNITGTGGVDGGTENDTFNLTAGVTTTIAGGANTDTIVAASAQATGFAITASNAGTVTNGAGTVGFGDVENLTGGSQGDTFTFSGTGGLTGTAAGGDGADQFVVNNGDTVTVLNGGNGGDTLTYAGSTGPVTLVLNVANLIESVIGTPSTQDVLRGTAAADTFATTSTTSVAAGGVTFSGFETFDGLAGADTFNVGHNLGAGTTLDGGADADTFNLTATGATALRGGAGADRFVFTNAVVANGVLDGGSEADVLDLRNYTTGRAITVTGPGAVDGLNGTDGSVPGGFQNIDDLQGSTTAADTLRGAGTTSTWTLAGNSGVYATAGRSLAFTSFSTLEGGAGADAFSLGGTFTGNFAISDTGGSDTANVASAVNVTGNLTLTNIETVTDTSGARITAGTLRITGATGGVGATNQALLTSVNNLEITGGNNIVVTELNGLTVSTVDAGTGTVRLTVSTGDLILGLVRGGNVRLDVLDGDIQAATAGTNVQGNPVALVTPFGTSGTEGAPITINTPTTGQILIESLDPATISNPNLATVLATRSSVIDVTVNQGIDLGTLGSSISRQEVAAIDWAGLDPNIALVDCLQPCIMLPADQSEEPGLVDLKEATKFLLIRTRDGWKMIPVMVRETVVAAR